MNPTSITAILLLKRYSNNEIAAAHLAIEGFGKVPEGNLAHATLKSNGLINEDGTAIDNCLKGAIKYEVEERMRAGIFN